MNRPSLQSRIAGIEASSRHDPGGRGLACRAPGGLLLPAAQSLLTCQRAVIVTGFCIRAAMIGETDGPPGALALASALRRLGKDVVLLSDDFSIPLLKAGMAISSDVFRLTTLKLPQTDADAAIDALLASFSPTHVVAIERPGNAADGHRYSMRGEQLDDLVPSADRLLAPPPPRTYRTLAVGDGGNELGLGELRDTLMGGISHGELIFSATAADHVIPAGISNWGAYALAAALSALAGKLLIKAPQHERAVLQAMVEAGAVDGCTRQRELSVDGLAWDDYARTLEDIYRQACEGLAST